MTLTAQAHEIETSHAPAAHLQPDGATSAPNNAQVSMIIEMPSGLIGLPEIKQIEIVRHPESWPFVTLRSTTPDGLQFLAIEPQDFVAGYVIELNDIDTETLGIVRPEEAQVLTIVTVHSGEPQLVTTNLIGPVVINRRTGFAKQVIIANSDRYSARHVLVDERA